MAQGVLLIIAGIWLLTQTVAGGLPARVLSLRHVKSGASLTTDNSGAVRV